MKKIIIKAFIDENQELQTEVLQSNTENIPVFTLQDDFTILMEFQNENVEDKLFVQTKEKISYMTNGTLIVPSLIVNDVDNYASYSYYKGGVKENLITTGHIVVFKIEIEDFNEYTDNELSAITHAQSVLYRAGLKDLANQLGAPKPKP